MNAHHTTTRIENAEVVLPDGERASAVLIKDGAVAAIDPSPAEHADNVIDAEGKLLIPGVVDTHVHFRDPGLTHKESIATGSRAAAKGGVTAFIDMPNTVPPATSVAEIHNKHRIASKTSLIDYGFYIAAANDNLSELVAAADADPPIAGIKIFIGSSTGNLLVDDQDTLERIFAETSLQICAHCEDEPTVVANAAKLETAGYPGGYADHSKVRDHEAAVRATRRAIDLAVRHEHRFHVLHVSAAGELPHISGARGVVTAEACPHHLLLDESDYARLGARAQVNPALKTADDRAALWGALADGTLDMVVTDHAPHTLEEKAQPYPASPSGLPCVENSLSLMLGEAHGGRCSVDDVVRWMCQRPAEVWGIARKGRIAEGYDADLVLVDGDETRAVRDAEQATACGWSPWDGAELTGWAVRTWVRGAEVWSREAGFASPGSGAHGRALAFER